MISTVDALLHAIKEAPRLFFGRAQRREPDDISHRAAETERPSRADFGAAGAAIAEWFTHTIVAVTLIASIWLVQATTRLLGITDRLFDILPIQWIFDATHLAVLLSWVIGGVRASFKAYTKYRANSGK
jgi:hypothetical protein